jgi:hypothetical protein
MKKLIAIPLLIFYLTALLKPIIPYIDFAINKEYIAKVLCINKDKPVMQCGGTCHLTKQLKKATEEEPNSKQNTPTKTEYKVNLFVHSTKEWQQTAIGEDEKTYSFYNSYILSQFLAQPPTPPPKSFYS